MRCEILKPFPFSTNGVNQTQATPGGEPEDIPDHLVPGLTAEGYVRPLEGKDAGASPENKMLGGAAENKGPVLAGAGGETESGAAFAPLPEADDTEKVSEPLTDDQLRDAVKEKTGRAPHPQTSREKLLAKLAE